MSHGTDQDQPHKTALQKAHAWAVILYLKKEVDLVLDNETYGHFEEHGWTRDDLDQAVNDLASCGAVHLCSYVSLDIVVRLADESRYVY